MTVDNVNKIIAAQSEVEKLIKKLLTRRAMGLTVDQDELDCLNKYLNVIKYLLLKAFQVFEMNRYQNTCVLECNEFEIILIRPIADVCEVFTLTAIPNLPG